MNLYDWNGANIAIFRVVNDATPAWLEPFAVFMSVIGSYWTMPVVLLGAWVYGARQRGAGTEARYPSVTKLLIAFVVALSVAAALKLLFDIPRPVAVLGDKARLIGHSEEQYSFPSGHVTFASLMAGCFWTYVHGKVRAALAIFVVLVAWSRIALGMHFPADVLAGAAIGATCSLLALRREPQHGDGNTLP